MTDNQATGLLLLMIAALSALIGWIQTELMWRRWKKEARDGSAKGLTGASRQEDGK